MPILFIWIASILGFTQSSKVVSECDYFEIDHMGNIYVVDDSELTKYNSQGKKIFSYSNTSLGDISSVDTSDPLRILVFYRDFNQIIYLNNKLSKIGSEINLYDFSDNETELVCNSQNGGFWIYNSIENQTVHISNSGRNMAQSILLSSFFDESQIKKITEHNGNLYLLFENKGLLVLDQNGQFIKKHQLQGIQDFQLIGETMYYQNKTGLFRHSPFQEEDELLLEKESSINKLIRLGKDKMYISNKKSISIKSISF